MVIRPINRKEGRKEGRDFRRHIWTDGWVDGWRAGKLYDTGIKNGELGRWGGKTNLVQSVHDCRKNGCPHETLLRLIFLIFLIVVDFATVLPYYYYF
jgi:hypothetical protein